MSPPEAALWRLLRTRPDGLQFRRQHPFGPYVLDFYCKAAALAIEIDGEAHGLGDNPARDERRDYYLLAHGVATLRIAAGDVRRDMDAVLVHVLQHCGSRTPPPAAPVARCAGVLGAPHARALPAKSRGGQNA